MKSGKRYWSDWTPVAGQQFEYGFDDIGNRTNTKTGGDHNGASLRSASYTANTVNQLTQRDVPPYLNVIGVATATATNVNVNNALGSTFHNSQLKRGGVSRKMCIGVNFPQFTIETRRRVSRVRLWQAVTDENKGIQCIAMHWGQLSTIHN